jgi:ribose transport system permease protein
MSSGGRPESAPLVGDLLPATPAPPAPGARSRFAGLAGPFAGLLLILIVGGLVELIWQHSVRYWSPPNQGLILLQTVTVAIGAIGMTIIIISGGIDLSVASVIALTAVAAAWVTQHYGGVGAGALKGPAAIYLPALAVVAAMLIGGGVGLVNGGLITRLKLAPFIITLGMMTFARGIAKWVAAEQKIDAPTSWIQQFTDGNLVLFHMTDSFRRQLVLPWLGKVDADWQGTVAVSTAVLATLVLGALTSILLTRTRFGRHVFAIGSNEATARLCGVGVERTKVLIYTIAGAMFGLAGVTELGRTSVGDPTAAMGKELDIIAAVVIGGGSLNGGSGTILGSLIGALMMAHLRNLCVHLGLPQFVQEIVVGAVIVVAVAVDRFRQRKRA